MFGLGTQELFKKGMNQDLNAKDEPDGKDNAGKDKNGVARG